MKEEKKGDKGRGRDIGLYKQTDEATTGIFDPHPSIR
jgi:predicted transcriptional regulator